MSKHDRLDMLGKLSMFDKYNDFSVFELYAHNHYGEIYSLYTLLEKSDINYSDIEFKEPLLDNDSFTFKCNCQYDTITKLKDFLEENKTIKYLRKKSFMVTISHSENSLDGIFDTSISFNKIIKEE